MKRPVLLWEGVLTLGEVCSPQGCQVQLVSLVVEEIAPEPGIPGDDGDSAAYPAGSGVNVVLRATAGDTTHDLAFSLLSPPYTSIIEQAWNGFIFIVNHASESEARFQIFAL